MCSSIRGLDRSQAIIAVDLSERCAQWQGYDAPTDGSGIYDWASKGSGTVRMTQREIEAHPRWQGFGGEGDDTRRCAAGSPRR